jgi:hypothetical protein
MIPVIRLQAGRAAVAGIPLACPAVQGPGKNQSRAPFADALHAIKKIGMGHAVSSHGLLQNSDLLLVALDILKGHRPALPIDIEIP